MFCMPHDTPPRRSGKETEMGHNYHPPCLSDLACCPDFIAEVMLNDEECTAAASAISDGDMAELGRIYLRAAEREASEYITAKSEECGITAGEAAARLYGIYRPAGNKAVAA